MFFESGHTSIEMWIRSNVDMFAGVGLGAASTRGTIGCKEAWNK